MKSTIQPHRFSFFVSRWWSSMRCASAKPVRNLNALLVCAEILPDFQLMDLLQGEEALGPKILSPPWAVMPGVKGFAAASSFVSPRSTKPAAASPAERLAVYLPVTAVIPAWIPPSNLAGKIKRQLALRLSASTLGVVPLPRPTRI